MNMSRQNPFRCLVTGASRGIGAAIVEDLASAGHRIALTARTEADLVRTASTLNVDTMVIPADATNRAAASLTVNQVVEQWGGLDVLVINAGEGVSASITATDDALWERMIEINLNAPFRYVRAAVPVMKEQGFGRIVVIASVASRVGAPYISAYTAAKHGVLGLVRSAAAELAHTGITVNAVCPGYVDTPMTTRTVDSIVAKTGKDRDTVIATLAREQGHGKLIAPREVAATVRFLIDDMGAVNGQGITLDGGKVQT
jgi:NAD(P)-dependent dehydrogenase (short-subunit alcohol dehydrogenase family)